MKILLLITILFSNQLFATVQTDSLENGKQRKKNVSKVQFGTASYYHKKFQGRPTASGEKYDEVKFTAAHNSLPINTYIRVTNLRNKRSVIVRVNDRLHHKNIRLVDLSHVAAKQLGYIGRGLERVKLEVLGTNPPADYVNK